MILSIVSVPDLVYFLLLRFFDDTCSFFDTCCIFIFPFFFFFFSRDIGIFHFIIWHSMGAAVISFFWFHSSVCSVHTILTITTMG